MKSTTNERSFLDGGNPEETHAFIQWKGTDVCLDFYCDCGGTCHFDGYFAYVIECPHCKKRWEMPHYLFPRPSRRADDIVVRPLAEDDDDHPDELKSD